MTSGLSYTSVGRAQVLLLMIFTCEKASGLAVLCLCRSA